MNQVSRIKPLPLWGRITLLIFLCYDILWIPILMEDDSYVWNQIVKSLCIDLIVCALISFINCFVLQTAKLKFTKTDWTNKKIGASILFIYLFNLSLCFPLAVTKWWLYETIFHHCPWKPGENWLDTYILSSVCSIIIVSYALIWVATALRQKEHVLSQAKIKAIKNQINPHFLFNNLNTGIALIDYAPNKAIDFFTSMSKVFRTVLERSMVSVQPLTEEMDDLEEYLNLLRIRFEGAIIVDRHVNVAECNMHILSGCLQLIFENIVKHNIFSAHTPMRVTITIDGDSLIVINDYRPLAHRDDSHGIGQLAIIHRYEDLGKHNASFRQDGDKYISQLPLFPAI